MSHKEPNMRFVKAVRAMGARTSKVAAFIILDPNKAGRHGFAGKVRISYPRDGAGRLHVTAWLPEPDGMEHDYNDYRHAGHAAGCGYDKATAALGGGVFYSLRDKATTRIAGQGYGWQAQLEQHGYIVVQAV